MPSTHLTLLSADPFPQVDGKAIAFFDIDNTLYSSKCGISEHMSVLIQRYFRTIGLPEEEATRLHLRYREQYSMALRGLLLHHEIDPLDYDKNCDAALPLEDLLAPDPHVRALLSSLDRRKVKLYALTNAYRNHAVRVLKILGLTDLIEAVVSCDYTEPDFTCKPDFRFFQEALEHAGGTSETSVYFVDDSALNVRGGKAFGWNSVLYLEDAPQDAASVEWLQCIRSLDELKQLWQGLFVAEPTLQDSA